MAILAIFTGEGMNKDMYENLRREVNWERNPPSGAVFHAASFDKSGNIHVANIWESEDQLNNFLNTRLIPCIQKGKMPTPKMEIFQIHNIDAFPGIDSHKVR
jgi:hypothetical protein